MNTPSEIDDMKFEDDESFYDDDDQGSDESDGKEKVVKYSPKPYTTFKMKPYYVKCFRCNSVGLTRVEFRQSV